MMALTSVHHIPQVQRSRVGAGYIVGHRQRVVSEDTEAVTVPD